MQLQSELHWAWRNVRARGWRAVLAIALLALALAANTLVFSTADSLVFRRVPYRDPERLIQIENVAHGSDHGHMLLGAPLLEEWRKHSDLFSGVHGYLYKSLFLLGNGEPERVTTIDLTPGLIDLLGVRPAWGRPLASDDARQTNPQIVLISELLARRRFGTAESAIGRELSTTGEPLLVVGVMPSSFRFPDGQAAIWRAFDPRGPLAQGFGAVATIARIAPGLSKEQLNRQLEQRSPDVFRAAGQPVGFRAIASPLSLTRTREQQRQLLLILIAAAVCLLLTACANVASLELANAIRRTRVYAVQLAVGATRGSQVRGALLEGVVLITLAVALAAGIAQMGAGTLTSYLPTRFQIESANPIDLDGRAFGIMAVAAALTWLLVVMPVVVRASRSSVMELLKVEGQFLAISRGGARLRRALTVAETAFAVMLLVGSVLYVRSYNTLVRLDKGFDADGVVAVQLTIPPQYYSAGGELAALSTGILERLRAVPGVVAASATSAPPSIGSRSSAARLEVDDRLVGDQNLAVANVTVDPDYFRVLRLPLRDGRFFETHEPPSSAIVSETFARRLWPHARAVGRRFRLRSTDPWRHVVGVVGHVRTASDGTTGPSTRVLQSYEPRQPPPPARSIAPAPERVNVGGMYRFLAFTVRLDTPSRVADALQAVRSQTSRLMLKTEFVDDVYAEQFGDTLLATRVLGSFGILAFIVAIAGIYGVMAFLVAARTREIGIRMALGADRAAIGRLVFGSSLRLVLLGAGLGVAAAVAAARWVESQLFGVRSTDPLTLTLVALAVIGTALAATWQPARQATRVDPSVLLRN